MTEHIMFNDLREKFWKLFQDEIGIPAEDLTFYQELHREIVAEKILVPDSELDKIAFSQIKRISYSSVVKAMRTLQYIRRKEATHKTAMRYDP